MRNTNRLLTVFAVGLFMLAGIANAAEPEPISDNTVPQGVPYLRPTIDYPSPALPFPYMEPPRVRDYINALNALRLANVPEAEAERIAAKLTPSDLDVTLAPLTGGTYLQAAFWAVLTFPFAFLLTWGVRRTRKPPALLARANSERDAFARVPL